jgi:hypothetical protein
MSGSVATHGNLEILANLEAERWGWRAEVVRAERDLEPGRRGPIRKPRPGHGQLRLKKGSIVTCANYQLPDDPERVRRLVRDVVRVDSESPIIKARDRE